MAKKKNKVEEEVVEDTSSIEAPVEVAEPKAEVSRTPKGTAPVATGRFYALPVEGGAVIVNRNGVIVSKVLPLDRAVTDAARMN